MHPFHMLRTVLLGVVASLPFVLVGAPATEAGASPSPITIAYITDLTGAAAPENGNVPSGLRGSDRSAECAKAG